MEYFLGALAGVIYGGVVGALKYILLWRKLLSPKDESKISDKAVYVRMFISYAVNFATLLAVFFARNIIPFDFAAAAIGTAVALSLSGKFYSIHKVAQTIGE